MSDDRNLKNILGRRGFTVLIVALMVTGCVVNAQDRSGSTTTAETSRKSPTGFGCYAYMHELGGLTSWRKHVRLMKAHGMNTFAIFTRGPQDIAAQIDIAVEEGMLEKDIPMFLLDHSGPNEFKQLIPNWDDVVRVDSNVTPGFTPGHAFGTAMVIARARSIAKHADKWPELITYSIDEPGRGEPMSEKDIASLRKLTERYNTVGYRCGTACIYPNVKNLVSALDVISVAWNWNGFIKGDMSDPQPTASLLAYKKGIEDFKKLTATEAQLQRMPASRRSRDVREVEKRLQKLRASFHWENLPPGEFARVRAQGKPWWTTVPELDLDELTGIVSKVISTTGKPKKP